MSDESPFRLEDVGSLAAQWPRITLVTAVRNGARYIEDTIRSVLGQGYPNLEYIVVDGVSTDGTQEIVRKYEKQITWWVSQPDQGVYDALNTGFAKSSGEVMGWLNASDMLQTNGLFVVGSVFAAFPEVAWITGRPTGFSSDGAPQLIKELPRWSRERFLAGANKYIQQESTFWRRSLWEKAGGALDASYRAEGDFELWVRFFRHAPLYSVDALIAGYRAHEDALSSSNIDRYNDTCDAIADRELATLPGTHGAKIFRRISRAVKPVPKVRGLWQRLAMRALYNIQGSDWPPVIEYRQDRWVMRK
jgi:glycosyltransferase involved in cell wall biosynthesis